VRQLVACRRCGSWSCIPRPSLREQVELHNADGYAHHPYFEERRGHGDRQTERSYRALSALARVIDIGRLRGGDLLDVGCDTGSFLQAMCSRLGTRGFGVDVSAWAVERARQMGLSVHCGPVEQSPPEYANFSLVTAVDVIEHVADPETFLRTLHQRIVPGGLLYVQTPNPASVVYGIGVLLFHVGHGRPRIALARLFPPEHVQYLSAAGLATLARRCGFEVVDLATHPLSSDEIMTSVGVRWPMMAIQMLDRLLNREILIAAVMRRL
jgi:2-polyprenyl-3-methyl-5-hydroxy-6-metoxy-1,4-benzoquinol methylase